MKVKNYYILTIAIISLGLLLTGGTYAFLFFNEVNIGENIFTSQATKFAIDYSASLTGNLFPSSSYEGGLSGEVIAQLDSGVSSATGSLYLATDYSTSSILYNGTEMGVALKYTVVDENDSVIASGTVDESILVGDIATGVLEQNYGMLICDNIKINNNSTVNYTVYLWLDGELVDNRYLDATFSGSIILKAVQDEPA